MNGLADVWSVYVMLYNLLQGWAVAYVPEAASRKVARHAIARLFQLACIGWETAEGVYAEAGDLAMNMLIREAWQEGSITLGAPEGQIPVPGQPFLDDLCRVYANVYQLTYFGQWSTCDRELICMAIRQYDPVFHDSAWLERHLAEGLNAAYPIRRAVDFADEHTCGEHLVCDAANQIWADEALRCDLWVKYRIPKEERQR